MNTLSAFLFPPPPSLFVNVMTVVSSAVVAVIGLSEARGTHLQYSKFWNTSNSATKSSNSEQLRISSRLGMLLLYTPAALAGAMSFWFFPNDDWRMLLLKSALTLHFFKRDFEVLFVHKYSGKMVLDSAILISLSYFSSTALMIYTQQLSKALPEPSIDLKNIGIGLFLVGITGNMYHHYLLSQTRKKGETGYKIPKGGLFNIVICPHYLCEITVYFGFALISQTLYSLCFAIATAIYLGGRSYATRKWVMIHQPASAFYEAQAGEFVLEAEELLKLRETITRVYVQRTGKPLWVVSEDLERDVFISATEAQAHGIVDLVAVQ